MGRILAVDDEVDMLALLKMIVETYTSHQVTVTNNQLEGLELIKNGGFDLVISDLKMPGLEFGFE